MAERNQGVELIFGILFEHRVQEFVIRGDLFDDVFVPGIVEIDEVILLVSGVHISVFVGFGAHQQMF